jgi:hypothetical protein
VSQAKPLLRIAARACVRTEHVFLLAMPPDALLQDVQIVYVQNEIAGPQGLRHRPRRQPSPLTMKAILMIQRVLAQFNLHSYLGKLVDFDSKMSRSWRCISELAHEKRKMYTPQLSIR